MARFCGSNGRAIAPRVVMKQSRSSPYTKLLQHRMQQLKIPSFRQLSRLSGVSDRQLRRLREGEIRQMRLETVLKLSQTLQWSVEELLQQFSPDSPASPPDNAATLAAVRQEYQRLQQQLQRQQETLMQEFQQSSLQVLETWLVQWPAAAAAAKKNPQLPALRLLPLMKPVEKLLQQWDVSAIAAVGEELDYDPQWHQLMSGTARPGDRVRVRYAGYCHGGKLLFRAKVSLVTVTSFSKDEG